MDALDIGAKLATGNWQLACCLSAAAAAAVPSAVHGGSQLICGFVANQVQSVISSTSFQSLCYFAT